MKIVYLQKNRKMTKEELLDKNPWKEIAENIDPRNEHCLYHKNNKYVVKDDECIIDDFNKKTKNKECEIILNTIPEPWKGNPLKANLIILSLNPGFVPEINKTLACLIQSVDSVRISLTKFRKETLELKRDSFFPDDGGVMPISNKEAEDMLCDWYWSSRLKELRRDTGLSESEFYKRVALIEFHGYSSSKYKKWYGEQYLNSQNFNKDLIEWICANRKDARFLILRSKTIWTDFLKDVYEKNTKRFLIKKKAGQCQYLTRENLPDIYDEIIKTIKGDAD